MDIRFEPAATADAEALRQVQDRAFYEDFLKHGSCPGYGRTAEDLADSMRRRATYKLVAGGEIVGKISAGALGAGQYRIGCLCVVPEYQNRGIGRRALDFLEHRYPDAREWTLETPADDARNRAFYERCGYVITGTTTDDSVELVIFTKKVKPTLVIRGDVDAHLLELKAWLCETQDTPAEEMADFFSARVNGYEGHMKIWAHAYPRVAELVPESARTLLDLGCGTGLEADAILAHRPEIRITGVDLCEEMMKKLRAKHPQVETVCGDFFTVPLGESRFDASVSVEALHHFSPKQKLALYSRLCTALKPGGTFILCDYLACCPEEEALLAAEGVRRRQQAKVPEDVFIHFDTPLTLEHETELMRTAGFAKCVP